MNGWKMLGYGDLSQDICDIFVLSTGCHNTFEIYGYFFNINIFVNLLPPCSL